MRIVDTHCHLIYLDRLRYPWLESEPALNRDFHLDDYRAEAEPAGIADVIHMEVDVAADDIEWETEFIGGLGVTAMVAACRPELPEFPDYLDRAVGNPRVKGFRRVLHTQPDDLVALAAVRRQSPSPCPPRHDLRSLRAGAAIADRSGTRQGLSAGDVRP